MSYEFGKGNLDKYFERELRWAIKAKQNSLAITIVIAMLAAVWQKNNIIRAINPPTDVINERIIAHNLPAAVELNSRKIRALSDKLNELEISIDDLSYHIKKKSYSRRR